MDLDTRISMLQERLAYTADIFGGKENKTVALLETKLGDFLARADTLGANEKTRELTGLEELFRFSEEQLDGQLTAFDKVRIVRNPQRVCLKDILENVYDHYTEIGGQDEYSIDPSMLIARATITRRVGNKVRHQPVMVIGQEKGHGQEFRNGGSVKPWGNAKALHYMKVAETENIPIHTYIFTPGSFPVEDYPGAAQQIAKNLYEMSALQVPVIAVISEGGSGGAEAIGLADMRLMFSHGYYSVISPEGAAAIESGIRQGQRAPAELIEAVARRLRITAQDNLKMGYIDRIIQEPYLGVRPEHYEFFKKLRNEVIRATNLQVLEVKGMKAFRAMALKRARAGDGEDNVFVRWQLSSAAKERLVWRRFKKFRNMSQHAYMDNRSIWSKVSSPVQELTWGVYSYFRYDLMGRHQKRIEHLKEELEAEAQVVTGRLVRPLGKIVGARRGGVDSETKKQLTELSKPEEGVSLGSETQWKYLSPRAKEDRTVTCPNAETHGCLDLWAPDLYGDFAGVCQYCGYHFPMENQWYVNNVFDDGSVREFNKDIEAGNPLDYEGFDQKIEQAKKKTGQKSACVTFEARLEGVKVVVAMLTAPFRGGTVGAAEGEKFIRAAERAMNKHYPFIAYVHGTAGIRIQEGTGGVIQMPRCTLAVRRYLDEGGLYLVVYDTNSYAGPVASFLGCSPYQFSVRSANIGFAGPGVIRETTGIDIPPDYHQAHQALSRGHIQGIWDRRDVRRNLLQALMIMGGRNLYYKY